MSKNWILWAIVALAGSDMAVGQKIISNNFRNPMDIPLQVSGTFAEIRPNHFHSGTDFTTNGTIGVPIHSVAEGFVSRIKVQSGGYGKAVYVQHPNGYTSVYAHLDRYASAIDSFVIARHYHRQQFDIDEYFKPDDMPIAKGEVIGYSGNTGGSFGPHLHFEIRQTSDEWAVNPLLFYHDLDDKTAPVISGVRVYPLGGGASVAGKVQPVYYKVVLVNGVYRIEGNPAIGVSGEIGLGIETIDYFTNAWRKCGIYSISMAVNGDAHFCAELDRFSFDQTRYINSYIDYGYKTATGKVIQKSFVDSYNKLDVYPVSVNDGKIKTEEGQTYLVKYKVIDAYGNASVMELNLKGGKEIVNANALSANVIPGNKAYLYEKENIKVQIPDDCFYTDISFNVKEKSGTGGEKVFSVGSRSIPLQQYITIGLKLIEGNKANINHLCIAKVNGSGVKEYVGGQVNSGWVTGRVREFGDYAIAMDSVPPVVKLHNAAPSGNYAGRKLFELWVKDNFSGISSFRCEIDGEWALFEYDAKSNRLICPLTRIPIKRNKKHSLKCVVVDGCDNESVKLFNFTY